jgi:alpha-beta hydrolase superfamily lysophospholipase
MAGFNNIARWFPRWGVVALLAIAALIVYLGNSGPALEPWHTAYLSEEFTARKADDIRTFEDYLALEDRLFEELREEVYEATDTGPAFAIWRYSAGSAADPENRTPNFNRSFELNADDPQGGVLLLHGMSDSPYSLRELGENLHARGYQVLGLRLPGHGTAPSGLRWVRWQDMAVAVRLSMTHLAAKVGDKPVHVVGYSTGAPLAIDLTLASLDDDNLATPASLVLVSPAIGITRLAALAGIKAAIGRVPGLGRIAWTQIVPEFDPYKYNSFTANAGAQVHNLTRTVASRISEFVSSGRGNLMPPILVFKSTVDATVSTTAVVDRLLGPLPENGNELMLFDINRNAVNSVLLISDPGPLTNRLMDDADLPFAITLISNRDENGRAVVARYKRPRSANIAKTESLGLEWPRGIISLSHVALPISPNDPLYGEFPPKDRNVLYLGQIGIRGERGLMRISSDWLLRLRYNPFYKVLENRVFQWLEEESRQRETTTAN